MAEDTSFLDKFTSKQAFVMGIIVTVLTLGTIGFLYTLKGGSLNLGQLGGSANNDYNPPADPDFGGAPPPAGGDARPVGKDDHIRGDKNAKITVIEYSDFECPFCSRFHPTMKQLISANKDVSWVYRHFPLTSIHSNAQKAAEASECAADQNKFWEYADKLFENSPNIGRAQLTAIAKEVGLNVSKFDKCVDSGEKADRVQADATDAQGAGGTGTPFSVIVKGDQQIPISGAVPLAQIQSIVDSLR